MSDINFSLQSIAPKAQPWPISLSINPDDQTILIINCPSVGVADEIMDVAADICPDIDAAGYSRIHFKVGSAIVYDLNVLAPQWLQSHLNPDEDSFSS